MLPQGVEVCEFVKNWLDKDDRAEATVTVGEGQEYIKCVARMEADTPLVTLTAQQTLVRSGEDLDEHGFNKEFVDIVDAVANLLLEKYPGWKRNRRNTKSMLNYEDMFMIR